MPFPGTRVIPVGWSQHHAPVAAGGMNATITIHNPAAGTYGWDEATESTTWQPGPAAYEGPARIQQVQARSDATIQADQSVKDHAYLIQILFDAPAVDEGWTVRVTDAVNDTHLVAWTAARPLSITDVQHGSERFTRDLTATINLD